MSSYRYLLRGIILLASVSALAGCADNPIYHQANHNTQRIHQQIKQDLHLNHALYHQAKISVYHRAYVDQTPYVMQPAWMKQKVELQGQFSFNQAVAMVTQGSGLNIFYRPSIKQKSQLSLNFSGTVIQALKMLQQKSGYHYTLSGNNLSWSNLFTQTFQISLMPGVNTFDLGKENTQSSNGEQQGSSQYSTLSGRLSIWKNIEKVIPELLSKKGKFSVSQANSSVTVTGHWYNVEAVKAWVKKLNKSLSEEVSIRVQILQIQLSKQFERGINWNLVSKDVTGSFGANLFSMLALSHALEGSSGVSFTGEVGSGSLAGSSLLVQALSSQGRISVKNSPVITTLNNQVAEIQQTKSTGYLKKMSVTSNGGGGFNSSANAEVTLTPGNIKTGLQLYALPKIQGNKIFLQISATLSKLSKLQDYSPKVSSSSSSLVQSSIQLPTVETKSFNQRSVLKNGQTLIVAGFNGATNQTRRTKYFDLPMTGGASGLTNKTETVLLITPHIIMR